jgi:hypothetical protein
MKHPQNASFVTAGAVVESSISNSWLQIRVKVIGSIRSVFMARYGARPVTHYTSFGTHVSHVAP